MAYDYNKREQTITETSIDAGLKAYMNKVYSFMAVGLGLTGAVAHLVSSLAFDFQTNTLTSFGLRCLITPRRRSVSRCHCQCGHGESKCIRKGPGG